MCLCVCGSWLDITPKYTSTDGEFFLKFFKLTYNYNFKSENSQFKI